MRPLPLPMLVLTNNSLYYPGGVVLVCTHGLFYIYSVYYEVYTNQIITPIIVLGIHYSVLHPLCLECGTIIGYYTAPLNLK